jgi:hypothetical protein
MEWVVKTISWPLYARKTPGIRFVEDWAPQPVWTYCEKFAAFGIKARGDSLYRICYPGP